MIYIYYFISDFPQEQKAKPWALLFIVIFFCKWLFGIWKITEGLLLRGKSSSGILNYDGRLFSPFTPLSWDPTCRAVSCSGVPNVWGTWICSRGDHEDSPRAGAPVLWRQLGELGVLTWRREGSERPYCALPVLKGSSYKRGREASYTGK